MTQNNIYSIKTMGAVAYVTIIGVLIAFFTNQDKKNPFVSFHVRQSLGLWLLYFSLGYFVGSFDNLMISSSFWIFFSVLFIYGIIGALTGKTNTVPLVGDFFQKIFKSLN
jgi:uncharacterized membrane protein